MFCFLAGFTDGRKEMHLPSSSVRRPESKTGRKRGKKKKGKKKETKRKEKVIKKNIISKQCFLTPVIQK